ncbi:glycerophosphodiester phosphodiesterase [Paenibacillus campi]|uniref:glycerophosphodiester phosphodiesterase n=1 Tax=Paenibacillus campi TaxID=3106031 RepID=UPI002AFED123|nr:glycerophosphodiester phosphodiesterase [Paenibacillus sp. SGZ-1009]
MKSIINYAHRGASGHCPENTMAAFRRGLELGATGIETDVQMSKDGILVLIHDESVQRTTGQAGEISELHSDEIRRLDAGSWYGNEFASERIPTLDELLDWAMSNELILNLELKNNIKPYTGMEEKLIQAVRARGLEQRILISSFNHYALLTCKRLAPDIRTGILYVENLVDPWNYARNIGAEALHPYHLTMEPFIVQHANAAGIVSNPFTINELERMRALIEMGCAGIITDYPDRLDEALRTATAPSAKPF